MNQKIFFTSLLLVFFPLFLTPIYALGSCKIESGPIPQLSQYSRDVDSRITALITEGSKSGNCGISPGGSSVSVEKTIETIDMAFVEIPMFPNMFLDFLYNIKIAINGESRIPVLRDGMIFYNIEKRVTNAISNVASQCALDGSVRSGLIDLLEQNQTLENIYKQAALGTPSSNFMGLSDKNIIIANAINLGYIPPATEACKDQNGTQEPITKILKAIQDMGKKSESTLADWRKGIALFQGGGGKMTIAEYTDIQRKLLQAELSRQGYSSRMTAAMLGNFDCFKAKTQGDDSAESAISARMSCLTNPILGIENLLLPWRRRVQASRTTNERVYQVNTLSTEEQLKQSIVRMDSIIRSQRTPAIDIKSFIMLNLIDLHLGLLSTSEAVEKRIPKMYADCMKGGIGVRCPNQ